LQTTRYGTIVAVMIPRETWTDGRLDEFAKRVDERFDAVDKRFDAVDKRLDSVDKRFDRIEADIRELRKTMDYRFFTLAGIMVTGFLALAGQNAF
jgi:hypothetical protein